MADLSGVFGMMDQALGAAQPVGPNDIVVHGRAAKPQIVQGQAPPGDPTAQASPSANAIYTGGQEQPAQSRSPVQDAFDMMDAALAAPPKTQAPAPSSPNADRKPTFGQAIESVPVGFNDYLANVAGAPFDAATDALRHPLQTIQKLTPLGGLQAASDAVGGPKFMPDLPDVGLPLPNAPPAAQSIKNALGIIGANPDVHPARSTIERIGRGAGAGAAAMLLPAAGLGAATEAGALAPAASEAIGEAIGAPTTGGQAAGLAGIGVASGAAGQGAEEVAPAKYAPLANLAGNLAGGGLAAGIGAGVGLLGKGAGAVGDFVAPLTAGGRQRTADQRLFKGATSPVASLDALENNPRELVPGSKPTTFQLTGDRGLGQMERQAAKKSPEPFLERIAKQTEARVGAVRGVAPVGDPQAVASMFKSHLAALDEMAGAVEGAARKNAAEAETVAREAAAKGEASAKSVAQTMVAELGGQGTPEAYGSELRARLQDAKDAAKASERALWKAVDPDGKLALDATPVSAAARRIVGELSPMAAPMNADEAGAFRAALSMNGGRRFSDVAALRTRLNEAMREELSTKGETATYRRLTMLRGAVEEAISGAVEQKATQEASAVAAGTLAPEDAMATSLQAKVDAYQGAKAEAAGAGPSGNYSTDTGGRSAGISGPDRAAISRGGQSPTPPRDQGLPEDAGRRLGTPHPGRAPIRLTRFLAANGGLAPSSELDAIFGGENPFVPGSGKLVRKGGMPLDRAREAATEAGYIFDPGREGRGPLETDINDLLDLVARDHGGDHQFPIGEGTEARGEALDIRNTESYLRRELKGVGINPNTVGRRVLNSAVDLIRSGEEPDSILAYERAVMQDREGFGNEAAARQGQTGTIHGFDLSDESYGASPREFAPQGDEGSNAGPRGEAGTSGAEQRNAGERNRAESQAGNAPPAIQTNFTQADRERLAAATAATKQRAATFGADPIGKILQTQGTKGAYRIADSALGEKIFPSGPGGAEAVQKFMAAAGDNPASQAQLRDLAAASLRRFAGQDDGTLNPARTVAWIKGHQDALRGVPGLAERFIGAGRASLAIDDASAAGKAAVKDAVARGQDAIEEAAAARRQSINDYQKGLIGKLIGSDNPTDTTRMIGSIFGRADSVKLMRRVATEARGNPEAIEGLKKAIVDHIRENFLTTRAEDGQTVEGIKGEAFKRFVSKNLGPLSQVFDPKDVAGIRLVADDLARSDQSIRTKLPGQSNTAQDTAHDEAGHNSLGLLTEAMVVGGETGRHLGAHGAIGHAVGFLGGAGAVIGKAIVSVMRASGMRTVDDAISEMLLHPDLAAAGIRRAMSKEEVKENAITFAQKLRRASVFAPSLAEEFSQDHKGKH